MTCAYCLDTQTLRARQVLWRGEHWYLCAPRGQLVEGYMAIAPYRCIGCLSQVPGNYFAELVRMTHVVREFYERAYGTREVTFYEQGRAGGGATVDGAGGFPLHAHLCCLPVAVDLHSVLARRYARRAVTGPHELSGITRNEPYIYADSREQHVVYVAGGIDDRLGLERNRLRQTVADLVGMPERGYWRNYPGDRELERLIVKWRHAYATASLGLRGT